jgi:hypothetical protein
MLELSNWTECGDGGGVVVVVWTRLASRATEGVPVVVFTDSGGFIDWGIAQMGVWLACADHSILALTQVWLITKAQDCTAGLWAINREGR